MPSHVVLANVSVHYARIAGVALAGVAGVIVSDVVSAGHGHNGIAVTGTGNLVRRVRVADTGCAAATVYGGDTATLTPGGNVVVDSVFTKYARSACKRVEGGRDVRAVASPISTRAPLLPRPPPTRTQPPAIRTYNAGVAFGGVGNAYTRNTISIAPHTGALGGGVANVFTENTFDTLCYESTDAGAWYAGRSWTNRGNALVGNTFVNIRNREHMTLGYAAVQAVYLDDQLSGTIIRDNVCLDSQTCFFVGGGRDNVVEGNTCGGAVDTCVHLDDRGLGWQAASCAYNATYTGDLVAGLFAVNYTLPPYATWFPEIVDTLARRPCVPVNNSIRGNRYCAVGTKAFMDASYADAAAWGDAVEGNVAMDC